MVTIRRVPTVLSTCQEDSGRNCLGNCCLPADEVLGILSWEDRMSRGLFRYDVTACETWVIAGEYGFMAQLNEGRHLKKRPTEFRVDLLLRPLDPTKLNFTKVGQEEILFRFEAGEGDKARFLESAAGG
ncbi:hypothetical protein C4D60_Mb06t17920 [Musa balbisiana]|uniref:GDPGP1-like N-terminal domain-containing protein n=1 Tax=Musa balbisiana TaxID=52838 RepID=A0A4S8INT8_MUSBA|nr:hypothetical protein C4D60_Mb06t17920 [Musa balbisiana]